MEKIIMIGGMSIYFIYCFAKIKLARYGNGLTNVTQDLAKIDKMKKSIREGVK